MIKALTIFSGNGNRELAEAICRSVEVRPGVSEVTTFSDGEVFVEIGCAALDEHRAGVFVLDAVPLLIEHSRICKLVQAVVMFLALIYIVMTLLADMMNALLDPRLRG